MVMLARQRCVLRLLSSGYYQDWRGDEVSSLISLLSRLSVKEIKPRSRLYSHLSHFGNSISLLKTNKHQQNFFSLFILSNILDD